MTFNYDYFGLTEPARIYLCKTDNTIICELNGIDLPTVSYTRQLNNFDTIQFDVHKYINGEESNGYDLLDEAMYILVDGVGYFRMQYPQVSNDGFDEYKTVTAQSCECELALKTLKNFKINTGETDSREYLIDGNVKETDEGVKVAVKNIILYDELYKDFSLLDIAIEKVFGWKIGWVDQAIRVTEVIETKVNDDGTVTTTSQMANSKRSFDIDSKNVYAFLTQDVSKKFECIFDFNIMTRTINVYSVKDYGKDSNVFISYRNLIQTLNYAPAQEDNIMTRFEVRGGDDLTIDAVNFGSSTIENLSYYLSTKHVSQGLIDRYNQWLSKLDEARKKYMYYNRQYSLYMEKRDEINLRVPNDGLNNNWKQFTVKDLGTIKKKYTTYMDALKDVNLGYWDEKNQKWLNKGAEQDYIAYQGILEIIDKTIEYKNNTDPTQDDKKSNEVDDLIEEWNTNWDLFGLQELKTKEKTYLNNIDALKAYKKAWKDLSEDEKGHLTESNYNISHNKYLKYWEYEYGKDENGNLYAEPEKGGCSGAIKQRQGEYDDIQNLMNGFSKNMSEVATINNKEKCGIFTKEDLETLNKLYNETDYVNDNIITISTNTAAEIINTQYELFQDATTELSKVCQPQLSFTLTMDNIFAIPGFKEWQGNFDIGNFIHLSFDKDDQYFLKLRISSLTFNPCVIENNFQIEFTNMISYNGGRDDFAVLLDNTVSTAKDQITGSVKSKLDTSGIEVSDALIKAMVSSTRFSNAVSNGVFDTINANTGAFGQVISKMVNARDMMANSGLFETINVDATTSKLVLALDINATRISAGTLSVDRLIIRGEKNSIMYSFNESLGAVESKNIPPEDYDKYYMGGKNIQAHTITADQILANSLTASEITTDDLRGINGWINLHSGTFTFYGKSEKVIIDDINKDKKLLDNYISSWESPRGTSGDDLRYKESMSFSPIGLNQEKLKSKIEELKPYTTDSSEVLTTLQKSTLIRFLGELDNYIIWLNVNDKIYKENKSASTLNQMTRTDLEKEFGINTLSDAERTTKYNLIKNYVGIKEASEEDNSAGLMAWNGQTLTVRGDIIANSLTLGKNVNISSENISDLKNYVTTSGLDGKLKDYTTTSDMQNEGLAFIVKKNGSIGQFDGTINPDDTKGYFSVNTDGLMIAQNAVVYGTIYAKAGKFTGDIIANSLTLGDGVDISTDKISGLGEYAKSSDLNGYVRTVDLGPYAKTESLSVYFEKDKDYGTIVDGQTGIKVSTNGLLQASNAIIYGTIYASSGWFKGELKAATGTFSGELKAATGSFSGNITASTGSIGPWNINSDAIYKGSGYNIGGPGNAYFGNSGLSISDKFIVDSEGNMTATDATISGTITASSGKIGLFNISNDGSIYNKPYGTAGSGSDSCGLSVTSGKYAFWAGSGAFYVNQDGSMHCSNADILGGITSKGNNTITELRNGQLSMKYDYGISDVEPLPKLLMGLDGNNEPYLYFYSVAPYTSVSISGGIIRGTLNGNVTGDVSGNVNGYIINSESTSYRPAICTSTDDGGKYYVSIIRTNVDNKITIRGKWDYQKFETRTFQLTTSDRRLKRNIKNTNIDNALSQILKINHREFIWKESNNYIDLGYIAQELEDINPNMVIKPSESNEPYGVNTFYMESLITKSIQEMYAELKAENKQLKQRIEYLEQQIN